MKTFTHVLWLACVSLVALVMTGCASTGDKAGAPPNRFTATDGRVIDIGKATPAEGGTNYNNPHMEKGKCWVAEGFNFQGYDTLYIEPTLSTAEIKTDNKEEAMVHEIALERLPSELARKVREHQIFSRVVTSPAEVKPEEKTLRLQNTITEFSKGGGAARYFAGLYGAGQPVLRVSGEFKEGDQTDGRFEARRSGASGSARMFGGVMKDEDVQINDIRSLVLDLTDFMAALAGKYEPRM